MSDTEVYAIPKKENRQTALEALEIGETISITRRVAMQYGFPADVIRTHTEQMRGIFTQQCRRARQRRKEYVYKIETGNFVTADAALVIVAAATRME